MKYTKSTFSWALFLTGVLLFGLSSFQTVHQGPRSVVGSWIGSESDCQGSSVSAAVSSISNASHPMNYSLAYRESLGFFDDISQEEWERMRALTLGRINNLYRNNPLARQDHPPTWYQLNWDPDFSCRYDTKVGVGDGAKVSVLLPYYRGDRELPQNARLILQHYHWPCLKHEMYYQLLLLPIPIQIQIQIQIPIL